MRFNSFMLYYKISSTHTGSGFFYWIFESYLHEIFFHGKIQKNDLNSDLLKKQKKTGTGKNFIWKTDE